MKPAKQPQTAVKALPLKPRPEVAVDFPQEREVVKPGHYAIRLTCPGATQAQIRTGENDWLDCRESSGHFWRDWAPQTGPAVIRARARVGKGRWTPVVERACVVVG